MIIGSISGIEGSVELVGARAVVGMFQRYWLRRRSEEVDGKPTFSLSAVLSYSKDSVLLNPKFRKKILIKVPTPADTWYELTPLPDSELKIAGDGRFVVEGGTLCLVEKK